jgi:hypothetical protein
MFQRPGMARELVVRRHAGALEHDLLLRALRPGVHGRQLLQRRVLGRGPLLLRLRGRLLLWLLGAGLRAVPRKDRVSLRTGEVRWLWAGRQADRHTSASPSKAQSARRTHLLLTLIGL